MTQFKSRRSIHAGKIRSWKRESAGISGSTDYAFFRIQFYTERIIRVTLTREDFFEDFSYAIICSPAQITLEVKETENDITLVSDQTQVIVRKNNFGITFLNGQGLLLNSDDELGPAWNGEQATIYKKLQDGERFIGLGEKTGPLDRKGHGYQHWNTDSYAYNTGSDPLYCSTPFYIGIHHQCIYGIFLDNSFKSFFNFGASNNRFSSFSVDSGELNYYFVHESTVANVIEQYTHLTGRIQMPPKWSIGYQQCRYSYFPDKEVLSIANTFREKNIPADVIVLDIHYMEDYKIFTWHKSHFPNPAQLMEALREKGFEVVVMCDPGIKVEKGYHAYEDGVKQDVFIKYPDGENYTGQVWPGWCHFPDFTKPAARQWWSEKFKEYVALGIKGFWNDMNEIATWGNQLPENIEMDFEGNKDSIRRGRNIYGFQMARATFEGTKKLLKGKRPFNLTRSGFSGIQRYAAVWTGDNVATDEHMMLGVRLLNSLGITGIAFCGYDAGGFVGDANRKLFSRWISLASFSPFFRGHSMVNSMDAEPWSFGEEAEEISRNYIQLRYRLMPYLYSAFYEATKTGIPIQRTLAINYPHDDLVYHTQYQHQYLFGTSIMIAPVESYKEFVKVYFPGDSWFDLFEDKIFHRGESIMECPVEKLPVFVKASSIIVMDVDAGSNTKHKSSCLEIHVYYGKSKSKFLLYQDDGDTYEYEIGNYCTQEIEFDPDQKRITILSPAGNYPSQYKEYKVLLHGFPDLTSIESNESTAKLDHKDYRFTQPLRSFDPIITNNEGYKIKDLAFVQIPNNGKSVSITWSSA